MKLTRRQLVAGAVAGSAAVASAMAQTVAPQSDTSAAPDFEKDARDNVQKNRETLAKFAIPMATEPAFQFKA